MIFHRPPHSLGCLEIGKSSNLRICDVFAKNKSFELLVPDGHGYGATDFVGFQLREREVKVKRVRHLHNFCGLQAKSGGGRRRRWEFEETKSDVIRENGFEVWRWPGMNLSMVQGGTLGECTMTRYLTTIHHLCLNASVSRYFSAATFVF